MLEVESTHDCWGKGEGFLVVVESLGLAIQKTMCIDDKEEREEKIVKSLVRGELDLVFHRFSSHFLKKMGSLCLKCNFFTLFFSLLLRHICLYKQT